MKYKKIPSLPQGKTREKIIFINMYKDKYKLIDLLDVLNISKSNYYKYRNSSDNDYSDYLLIKEIFDESKGTYGYRRIEEGLLEKWGLIINHKKIQHIMKKYNIRPHILERLRINHTRELKKMSKQILLTQSLMQIVQIKFVQQTLHI
ncbi:MAG: IS3 family transposase [Clostridia bacterium]|nr:IS3 family transposase [Clostridia bacterium]